MVAVLEPVPVRDAAPAELDEVGLVLMDAAAIVRKRWHQGGLYSRDGERACAIGAIYEASGKNPVLGRLITARVKRSIGIESLSDWNDTPGRTAEEVAMAMERAAIHA